MSKTVALPWYHRADWPRLLAQFADRDAISDCYDAWKNTAIAREARWQRDGYDVKRIELRPEAFDEWCRNKGRPANYASRRAYVDEMLTRQGPPAAALAPTG